MFSNFNSFEQIIQHETPEEKEKRILFELEKKQELKKYISQINKEIFQDLLPIQVNKTYIKSIYTLERLYRLLEILL